MRRAVISVVTLLAAAPLAAQRQDVFVDNVFGPQIATSGAARPAQAYSPATPNNPFVCNMGWRVFQQGGVYTYVYTAAAAAHWVRFSWPASDLTTLHWGVVEYDSRLQQGQGGQILSDVKSWGVTFSHPNSGLGDFVVYLQSRTAPADGRWECADLAGQVASSTAKVAPPPPPPYAVSSVHATATPVSYKGQCPADVQFDATIVGNSPALPSQVNAGWEEDNGWKLLLTPTSAGNGRYTVSTPMRFAQSAAGTMRLHVYFPTDIASTPVAFQVQCIALPNASTLPKVPATVGSHPVVPTSPPKPPR